MSGGCAAARTTRVSARTQPPIHPSIHPSVCLSCAQTAECHATKTATRQICRGKLHGLAMNHRERRRTSHKGLARACMHGMTGVSEMLHVRRLQDAHWEVQPAGALAS